MQVVVIGGGIIGLASAYELAGRGVEVVVCERSTVGAGSTERSAGGIRTQFSTAVNIELSLASMAVWESFEDRFGVDIDFRRTGYLFLARSDDVAEHLEATVERQQDLGVSSRLLTPEAALEHCPGLHTEHFQAASFAPTDGFADPHLALEGYKAAALDRSVALKTNTPITDIHVEDDAVVGVSTPAGRIEADAVVNAAGPWAARVGAMAGVELPVSPRRRRVAVIEPDRPVPASNPLSIDLETGVYFRPERGGNAIAGGHFDEADPPQNPDAYDESIELSWSGAVLERAMDVASYFGLDSAVRDGWAGLYAVTPDNHPIIEETRPGLVSAVGFSGHGFQHAPATGRLVSELVVDGTASTVDIDELSSDRFEAGESLSESHVA